MKINVALAIALATVLGACGEQAAPPGPAGDKDETLGPEASGDAAFPLEVLAALPNARSR